MPTQAELQDLRVRLETEDLFYAESVIKIIDQREQLVPIRCKEAQKRLYAVMETQEKDGKPVRVIVLKARREGISTAVQARMIKRCTQRRNHKGLVVAHDSKTAAEIFQMGETMYSQLPPEVVAGLLLKPEIVASRKGQELRWGQPSRSARLAGDIGLNSSYLVDTANEFEAGRGFTYHSLHLSEFAFWAQPEKKLRSLLSTLPDTPESMCVIESTANAYNLFRKLWVAALAGNSDYYALFIPWFEDPEYVRRFEHAEERLAFIDTIGEGPYGEAEPDLVDQGVEPEQLAWRRWAIQNRTHGDLRGFMQEFPANWEEAFLASGRQVFAPAITAKVAARTEKLEPHRGLIVPKNFRERVVRGDVIQVPESPEWQPDDSAVNRWDVWVPPFPGIRERLNEAGDVEIPMRPPGQYVLTCDSASGLETETEGQDYFAIQVIDHRTREQCAQFRARGVDSDLVAIELYKAAMWYAPEFKPWVGVEVTGGYGVSIVERLYRLFGYSMLYRRTPAETKGEKPETKLGWSMNAATKPLVVDHARQLLRDQIDGIRSAKLAAELQTFVRDEKGRMAAETDYFDDLLDAWMVAQYIAHVKPVRRSRWLGEIQMASASVPRAPSLGRRARPRGYAPR